MAPNGHGASRRSDVQQSQATQHQSWLDQFGHSEYQNWRNGNPTKHLSYDDWKTSQHVDGLSLYYATLQIFEESDSTGEETELIEVKPRACGVRGPPASKKKKIANGNGPSRTTGSVKPSVPADSEDQNASAKRKRKSRKKYLSEEIVASDGDSEVEEVASSTSPSHAPLASNVATSGRQRKPYARKPRKTPLSEEIISPEDELDDPIVMDQVVTSIMASPLPVRTAAKNVTTTRTSDNPKKTILKLSTRKVPRKKFLSEETVIDDDTDDAKTPSSAKEPAVNTTNGIRVSLSRSNIPVGSDNEDEDLDSTNESALATPGGKSDASTRRGLRARRPAQQRPYYHDAQLFDDVEPNADKISEEYSNIAFDSGSRRTSMASLTRDVNQSLLEDLPEDSSALLQVDSDPEFSGRRPKHFKGKGRAWKKEESDEDEDFTLAKKKAAKAARAKQKTPVAVKKRGRPRKSVLSEDIIRDESDSDVGAKAEDVPGNISPVHSKPQTGQRRAKAKPKKKSALSEEIVRDDSDSVTTEKANAEDLVDHSEQRVATPSSQDESQLQKPVDQITGPKTPNETDSDAEALPSQSFTPQGTPRSNSAKGTPIANGLSLTEATATELKGERDKQTTRLEEVEGVVHAKANTPTDAQSGGREDAGKLVAEPLEKSVHQTPLA